MAKRRGAGDWLVLEEKLERGDPSFVDDLRSFYDADVLAEFAARWYTDKRVASRRLLLEYLDRPLNAFRHEALVKRLFKLAEAAGDDEVMARFMVLFDRSIRREERRRMRREWRTTRTQAEADQIISSWRSMGLEQVGSWKSTPDEITVEVHWNEPVLGVPFGTTMPRDKLKYRNPWTGELISDITVRLAEWFGRYRAGDPIPARARKRLDRLRLFSVATRQYLRRRAWRYFRRLGKNDPGRYVTAVSRGLVRYTDSDVSDGLALIDNWSLIHVLFHRSAVLASRTTGWAPAEGRSLAELSAAPCFERLWEQSPRAIIGLLTAGRCRPVRQWAIQMVRRHDSARAAIGVEDLFEMVVHEDSDVVALAVERFRSVKGIEAVSAARWLELIEKANPAALEVIAELIRGHVNPARLEFAEVVWLAASRPLPVARLGLEWLTTRVPRDVGEDRLLLALTEAMCEPLRRRIVAVVRTLLESTSRFEPEWVLEFLDSRHAEVRAEGIGWFRSEPRVRDDALLWRRLGESPYDDVRLFLIAELESRVAGRDLDRTGALDMSAETLRLLWATVLLNIHRGSRAKPKVTRQIVHAIRRRPEDAEALLPLLGVALRSARGPERRAGLAALAEMIERQVRSAAQLSAFFPELKLL